MKILALSDIHGNISGLEKIADLVSSCDYILIAGDITHFGEDKEAAEIIEAIEKYNKNIIAVAGNCDNLSVDKYLEEKGIGVNCKTVEIGMFTVSGFSGSITTPVPTPNTFPESAYEEKFKKLDSGKTPDILLCHQPPFNTDADKAMKIKHVGSHAIWGWLEEKKPLLCVCGHIHESRCAVNLQWVDGQSNTLLVNPGSFKEGFFSLIVKASNSTFTAQLLNAWQM